MLHLGTATALLAYFWRDWWTLAAGVFGRTGAQGARESRRVLVRIVVATIHAVATPQTAPQHPAASDQVPQTTTNTEKQAK
jgi:undecaprenyl pyrophosphate phosphatase UppP